MSDPSELVPVSTSIPRSTLDQVRRATALLTAARGTRVNQKEVLRDLVLRGLPSLEATLPVLSEPSLTQPQPPTNDQEARR